MGRCRRALVKKKNNTEIKKNKLIQKKEKKDKMVRNVSLKRSCEYIFMHFVMLSLFVVVTAIVCHCFASESLLPRAVDSETQRGG